MKVICLKFVVERAWLVAQCKKNLPDYMDGSIIARYMHTGIKAYVSVRRSKWHLVHVQKLLPPSQSK